MKKPFLLIGLLLLLHAVAFAQGGKITFEKTIHDFGVIKEEGGPVSVEFKFTNTGTAPLIVSKVQPSCGCTTPGWTKEPVAPGESGTIKAEYNPHNRPGTFTKTLNVTSNGEPNTFTLTIKGTVTPKPKTIKDELPDSIGNLRLASRYLNFGKVTTEKPVTKEFILYNSSDKDITFKDEKTVPAHIKVSIEPKTIKPKERATMKVTYDAKAKNDYGFMSDPLVINTNEKEGKKELHVSAQIEEYFPPMTPSELEKAPKISFEKTDYDFGVLKQGVTVSTDFKFTNTGKSDLYIRKTKANCGCTASEPDKKVLKPGESSMIKVTYNTTGKHSGTDQKEVTVFSNDPTAPTKTLKIKANISE